MHLQLPQYLSCSKHSWRIFQPLFKHEGLLYQTHQISQVQFQPVRVEAQFLVLNLQLYQFSAYSDLRIFSGVGKSEWFNVQKHVQVTIAYDLRNQWFWYILKIRENHREQSNINKIRIAMEEHVPGKSEEQLFEVLWDLAASGTKSNMFSVVGLSTSLGPKWNGAQW